MKTKIIRALHQESGMYRGMCAGIVEKKKEKRNKVLEKEKKRKRIKEDVISKSFHYRTGPGCHEQTTKINSRGELAAFTRKTLWYVPSFSISYPFFHSP